MKFLNRNPLIFIAVVMAIDIVLAMFVVIIGTLLIRYCL